MELKYGQIKGVIVEPLKKFPDERGTIMHGVRCDNIKNDFGEVYFKKLYSGIINGWHVHETLTLNYICIFGNIKLVLVDLREDSETYQVCQEVYFGDDHYCLVHIPPGIANASKSVVQPFSIMTNIASLPHDPNLKYQRICPHSEEIPYDWDKKDY